MHSKSSSLCAFSKISSLEVIKTGTHKVDKVYYYFDFSAKKVTLTQNVRLNVLGGVLSDTHAWTGHFHVKSQTQSGDVMCQSQLGVDTRRELFL